jgi:hypothetical protein
VNLLRRHVSVGIFAAAAAGLTWAVATGTVDNYPATIRYTVSLPGETITSITAQAYPSGGGNPASVTVNNPPVGQLIDLVVNGGDPSNPADTGLDYISYFYNYLSNPTAQQTYLRLNKKNSIHVDNTASTPSAVVPVSFSYSAARRINVSLNVIGAATISSYSLYASSSDSAAGEERYAQTYGTTNLQPSATTWVPMVPASNVSVSGTVTIRHSDSTFSQRNLTAQTKDVTSGNATASWTIDLTNLGYVEGDIALITQPVGATVAGYTVRYVGASTPTSGIYGSISVTPAAAHYAVELTPGDYDFYLSTSFNNPQSSSDTQRTRVTVAPGINPNKNFFESFGKARTDLNVGGFYTTANLNSAQTALRNGSSYGYGYQRVGTSVEQVVPYGTWQSYYTYMRLYDNSTPLLPLNNQMYRIHNADPEFPATVIGSPASTSVGTESPTLVRANVYFDVIEPTGTVQVVNPSINASKIDYSPGGSLLRQSVVYASGSSTPQQVSGLTMVGEPGTYTLTATATVNGQQTNFGRPGSTITFGNPVVTPPGAPAIVLTDEDDGAFLNLAVSFGNVTGGGLTTVVENPIGPAPPEGFRTTCAGDNYDSDGDGVPDTSCDPRHYDITSTAQWTGTAKVCIRRTSILPNGVAEDLLKLFHYNAPNWELLPPPADGTLAFFDCSADFAQCGCTSDADCGIDYTGATAINAYLICGETTSFSPFTLFEASYHFSNEVNGVTYTGPTGPPALQQWEVPSNGTYRITASGASGARATAAASGIDGGCGAEVTGDFVLQARSTVEILVGQMGIAATNSAGGGGGTFVVKNGSPLLVAGGGGGVRAGATVDGRSGGLANAGIAGSTSASYASGFIAGGVNGAGGARVSSYGSGGGGWSGNGAADGAYGEGGFSFLSANQGRGGAGKTCAGGLAHGGYGGGGAGNGCYGGGGGGGYSGGGGGRVAGGGGSFNAGANGTGREGAAACTPDGQGQVTIEFLRP